MSFLIKCFQGGSNEIHQLLPLKQPQQHPYVPSLVRGWDNPLLQEKPGNLLLFHGSSLVHQGRSKERLLFKINGWGLPLKSLSFKWTKEQLLPESSGGKMEMLAVHPQISTHLLTPFYPLTCLFSHFTSFLRRITAVSHMRWPSCLAILSTPLTKGGHLLLLIHRFSSKSYGVFPWLWTNRWMESRVKGWTNHCQDEGSLQLPRHHRKDKSRIPGDRLSWYLDESTIIRLY